MSWPRKIVRRDRCPRCRQELAITRAELRAGVAHCACGVDLALAVHDGGDGPSRAMQVVEARPLLGAPPSPRIVERLHGTPTLEVRPADEPPLLTLDTLGWRLRRLLRRPLRIRVVAGALEVRGTSGGTRELRVETLGPADLPLDGLDLDAADRAWILGWIREHTARR